MSIHFSSQRCVRKPIGSQRAFTLIELLTVVAIIGLLVGMLAPALRNGRNRANSVSCMGNLRQLGLSLRMYADDNDGFLPSLSPDNGDTNRTAIQVLKPYVKGNSNVFVCKEDDGEVGSPGYSSYQWNALFNRRRIDPVPGRSNDLISQPMLSDYTDLHGYRNGVFPDGHVKKLK